MNPEVDAYIGRSDTWPEVMTALRPILLDSGLTEEIKWGKPCYSHDGRNIVILQEMKEFLALMFSGVKQAKTRTARVEKHAERILHGKGCRDR